MLQIKNLSIEVGGRVVLEDATFTVRAGDKAGLVGRNGVGKTSLLRVLAGEQPAVTGAIHHTGALGYLGFKRESQLSILIRAAICKEQMAYFYAGAGIVADSKAEAEYEETLAKAQGLFQALGSCGQTVFRLNTCTSTHASH